MKLINTVPLCCLQRSSLFNVQSSDCLLCVESAPCGALRMLIFIECTVLIRCMLNTNRTFFVLYCLKIYIRWLSQTGDAYVIGATN